MLNKFYTQAKIKKVSDDGKFEIIASSGKVDRLGDTINPNGWYLVNYKKNPVILWSHSTGGFLGAAIPPVAKADKVWIHEEKELRAKGQFADTLFAQEIKTLVEGGFLNAVSVGFIPLIEDKKGQIEIEEKMYRRANDEEIIKMNKDVYRGEGERFEKQELLEISWVNVPALPSALVAAGKANFPLLVKALESPENDLDLEIKPFAEEHSCRILEPKGYKKFRRKGCAKKHEGKCIDHIYGIKDDGDKEVSELQAMRYSIDEWNEDAAKKHCQDAEGRFEPAKKELKLDKELIQKYIAQSEIATNVLKDLISPDKGITPKEAVKGREPPAKQKSKRTKMERMLIMFGQMVEALLKETRQQNEKER